jgi:hypothetical protein
VTGPTELDRLDREREEWADKQRILLDKFHQVSAKYQAARAEVPAAPEQLRRRLLGLL